MSVRSSAQLGDVATFIRGITFKPDDVVPVGYDGSVACMRTRNVQSELDLSDVWGVPQPRVKRKDQFLTRGDVLVSSANSWNLVGKCCWVPELSWQATFGGFVSVLRADEAQLDARYLYHWFSSPWIQTTVRTFGRQTTNISNLDIKRCLRLQIPLPPLPEQRRIAAILDKADALRTKRRAAIAKLDELTQSIFLDMFGDPQANQKGFPIKSLSEFYVNDSEGTKCGPFGSALKKGEFVSDGVPVWNMDNIDARGRMALPCRMWITPRKFKQLAAYAVRDGDVIISRAGTVGKMCVIAARVPESIISTNLIRVRFGSALLPSYFVSLMTYCKGRVGRLKTGPDGAFTHMSTNILDTLKFPYPPPSLQKRFAETAQSIEAQTHTLGSQAAEMENLFAALQQRAFRGEL